jgi:hypothetical protein
MKIANPNPFHQGEGQTCIKDKNWVDFPLGMLAYWTRSITYPSSEVKFCLAKFPLSLHLYSWDDTTVLHVFITLLSCFSLRNNQRKSNYALLISSELFQHPQASGLHWLTWCSPIPPGAVFPATSQLLPNTSQGATPGCSQHWAMASAVLTGVFIHFHFFMLCCSIHHTQGKTQ